MDLRNNSEKKNRYREIACSADVLKWVGFVCVCLASVSFVIQRCVIGLESFNSQTLHEALAADPRLMGIATAASICMLLATVAIPIYAKLVYEGWQHTANQKLYLAKVAAVALVSEFFYDLVVSGKLVDMSRQNPVWALVISIVMLAIFRQYCKPGWAGMVLKVVLTLAALAWATLLQTEKGGVTILLVTVFSLFPEKKNIGTAAGVLISALEFPAPFGMFFAHVYDGRKGNSNRRLFYFLYPAQLLLFGILGLVLKEGGLL